MTRTLSLIARAAIIERRLLGMLIGLVLPIFALVWAMTPN